MSSAFASATRKKTSSVLELMTSIWSELDGLTHSPPMKKRSGELKDTLAISVRLIVALLSVISVGRRTMDDADRRRATSSLRTSMELSALPRVPPPAGGHELLYDFD